MPFMKQGYIPSGDVLSGNISLVDDIGCQGPQLFYATVLKWDPDLENENSLVHESKSVKYGAELHQQQPPGKCVDPTHFYAIGAFTEDYQLGDKPLPDRFTYSLIGFIELVRPYESLFEDKAVIGVWRTQKVGHMPASVYCLIETSRPIKSYFEEERAGDKLPLGKASFIEAVSALFIDCKLTGV